MSILKQVRPEDFDIEQLRLAAQSGKLFIDVTEDTADRETIKKNVRAYVHRIDSLATPRFSVSVDALWDAIFHCKALMDLMMPKPKARKCRDFDKYSVVRIIGVLREKGVYEQYSDMKYMALLEQTDEDCSYRSYLGMGIEQRALLAELRTIVEQF